MHACIIGLYQVSPSPSKSSSVHSPVCIYVLDCPDRAGWPFTSACGFHTLAWPRISCCLWGSGANFIQPVTYTTVVEWAHFFRGCLWGHMVHLSMADAESKHREQQGCMVAGAPISPQEVLHLEF